MDDLHFEIAAIVTWRFVSIGELVNYKAHVFITFILEDKHRLSLEMLMHIKYICDLCSLLDYILIYLIVY
jgi:hypothetical protein